MDKLEIREVRGRFALYKGNCPIGIITITRMFYGSFSLDNKVQYNRLMKKFGIKHGIKIVADDREVIETFLRFLKSHVWWWYNYTIVKTVLKKFLIRLFTKFKNYGII